MRAVVSSTLLVGLTLLFGCNKKKEFVQQPTVTRSGTVESAAPAPKFLTEEELDKLEKECEKPWMKEDGRCVQFQGFH